MTVTSVRFGRARGTHAGRLSTTGSRCGAAQHRSVTAIRAGVLDLHAALLAFSRRCDDRFAAGAVVPAFPLRKAVAKCSASESVRAWWSRPNCLYGIPHDFALTARHGQDTSAVCARLLLRVLEMFQPDVLPLLDDTNRRALPGGSAARCQNEKQQKQD